MPSELLHDLLMKQSATRLRQMRDRATDDMSRLKFEVEYIDRAIAAKENGRPTSGPSTKPSTAASSGTQPRRGSKRGIIRDIAGREPDRLWMPAAMRDQLAREGIAMSGAAVRVAMRRMIDEGIFERGPHDEGFKLVAGTTASGNGSGPPTLSPETVDAADGEDQETRLETGSR